MRVKKGLYVAHREDWRNIPIKELAANLIYGPSYVSLQYALAFYGMIPEAAVQLTSVTFKKTKQYHTPLGDFTYRSVSLKYYLPGVVRQRTREGFSYMIAAREKALMDMLYFAPHLKSMLDVQSYILEDLRIDEETIGRLDLSAIDQMSAAGDTVKLSLCNKAINRLVRWNR